MPNDSFNATPGLVLASGSATRRQLLDRLRLDYRIDPADIDERLGDGESAAEACLRLAREKAIAVAGRHPGQVVLGSDQLLSWMAGFWASRATRGLPVASSSASPAKRSPSTSLSA